jgi:N-acetylglucosamine-6-phosphate deacetylase
VPATLEGMSGGQQGYTGSPASFSLRAAALLTPAVEVETAMVRIVDGRIAGVDHDVSTGPTVELGDHLVVPGFVDVHVHGGGGAQVNGDDPDEVAAAIATVAATHAAHGTTSLLATAVSDSHERLVATLTGIARAARADLPTTLLGAHLEGPWLAPDHAGAQDPRALRPPSLAEWTALRSAAPGAIRMLTLAPELPGALDVVREAVAAGAVVSVGHTGADYAQTVAAFDAGARHATHLFNGMPPLHHRRPGPVGAALADQRVSVELIADGHHVHPAVLGLVLRLARSRVVAVTDATSAAGLVPGRYALGRLDVVVAADRVTLADDPAVLAGSVLTMAAAVRALVAAGASVRDAVAAATRTPADLLGETGKGRIEPGADADLVVLDRSLHVAAVVHGGRVVHDPRRLFGSVAAG